MRGPEKKNKRDIEGGSGRDMKNVMTDDIQYYEEEREKERKGDQ